MVDLSKVNLQPSFTLDGDNFYQTSGGNSWSVNYRPGDQCIKNPGALTEGAAEDTMIFVNIVKYP
jgi:hypothetical protein